MCVQPTSGPTSSGHGGNSTTFLAGLGIAAATAACVWLTGRYEPQLPVQTAVAGLSIGVACFVIARVCCEAGDHVLCRPAMFAAGLIVAAATMTGISQTLEPRHLVVSEHGRAYGSEAPSLSAVVGNFKTAVLAKMTAPPPTKPGGNVDDFGDLSGAVADMTRAGETVADAATVRPPDRLLSLATVEVPRPTAPATPLASPAVREAASAAANQWRLGDGGLRVEGPNLKLITKRVLPVAEVVAALGKPDVVRRSGTGGDCWLGWSRRGVVAYARKQPGGGTITQIGFAAADGRHAPLLGGHAVDPRTLPADRRGITLRHRVLNGRTLVVFELPD